MLIITMTVVTRKKKSIIVYIFDLVPPDYYFQGFSVYVLFIYRSILVYILIIIYCTCLLYGEYNTIIYYE